MFLLIKLTKRSLLSKPFYSLENTILDCSNLKQISFNCIVSDFLGCAFIVFSIFSISSSTFSSNWNYSSTEQAYWLTYESWIISMKMHSSLFLTKAVTSLRVVDSFESILAYISFQMLKQNGMLPNSQPIYSFLLFSKTRLETYVPNFSASFLQMPLQLLLRVAYTSITSWLTLILWVYLQLNLVSF